MFDMFTDVVFIIDIILNFFFVEEDVNGEMIIDQKKIAITYFRTWFFIDLIASIPVTFIMIFLANDSDTESDLISIRFLKLAKFTRMYRLLTLFKLAKLFKNHNTLEKYVSYLNFTTDAKHILSSLIRMVFLIHIVGCIFSIVAFLSA